jgi:hypothetical protein
VVPGQDGALQVGDNGFVVAKDAGKYLFFVAQLLNQVGAQLFFHGAGLVARGTQLAQGADLFVVHAGR